MTTKNVTNYLLLKAPPDAVKKLQEKSDGIISVFTKTINELKVVNDEVDKELTSREQEKARIENELVLLNTTKAKNTTTINKINSLLS